MLHLQRIEYTMKALVGGAGAGLALVGAVSFFPVTITTTFVIGISVICSTTLAGYTFLNVK